mmetsp:Transcript_7781/g.22259  ORF Transcript_7781/g.22259 Transcript_7781/m.22259 type:complete len:309 (+) Transcript_7781:54-980(+)
MCLVGVVCIADESAHDLMMAPSKPVREVRASPPQAPRLRPAAAPVEDFAPLSLLENEGDVEAFESLLILDGEDEEVGDANQNTLGIFGLLESIPPLSQAKEPTFFAPPAAPCLRPAPAPFSLDGMPPLELPPAFDDEDEVIEAQKSCPVEAPRQRPAAAPFDLDDLPSLELPPAFGDDEDDAWVGPSMGEVGSDEEDAAEVDRALSFGAAWVLGPEAAVFASALMQRLKDVDGVRDNTPSAEGARRSPSPVDSVAWSAGSSFANETAPDMLLLCASTACSTQAPTPKLSNTPPRTTKHMALLPGAAVW